MLTRRRERLLQAAVNGVEVWLSYALVEYLFASAIPILLHREKMMDEARWRGTALLFACFAIWGVASGLLGGLAMDRLRRYSLEETNGRVRKVLLLSLVAVFGLNLLPILGQSGSLAALAATILVAIAVLVDAGRKGEHAGLSSSPVTVAVALIAPARLAFINWRNFSDLWKVPMTVAAAAVALAFGIAAIRIGARVRTGKLWGPIPEQGLITAAIVGLIFGPSMLSFSQSQIKAATTHAAAEKSLPNIIMVTMDTVRSDHMGIYGYSRQNTPNLKELLSESTLYTHLIAASTMTLSSHASIFTGLYPRAHGAYKQYPAFPYGRPLNGGIPTLAAMLESAGYRSVAVSANFWYLGPEWGLMRGFEYSWTPQPFPLVDANHPYLLRCRIGELFRNAPVSNDLYTSPAADADTINRRATGLLNQLGAQPSPFFLFLNYMDAHWPYRSPSPFDTTYPGREEHFAEDEGDDMSLRNLVECEGKAIPAGYADHVQSQYDGAIAFMDFKIGELVRYLKKSGLYDNTLLIITSDHGEALGDHGGLSHNVSVYQDQIHVPLIVKYPRTRTANQVEQQASHVDFLPTVLDVAGLPARPDLPGVSLRRLASLPDRVILSERHFGPCPAPTTKTPAVQYAVFQGSSKLITSSPETQEFYDLAKDPEEQHDLHQTPSSVELDELLKEWMRHTSLLRQAQQPADRETLNRLRSLGYLQ